MNTAEQVRAIIAEQIGLKPEDIQDADGLASDLMLHDLHSLSVYLWLNTELSAPPSRAEMQACLFVRDVIELVQGKLK